MNVNLTTALLAVNPLLAEDEARLSGIRALVQIGLNDIERGDCRHFESTAALGEYLELIADETIQKD